MTTRIGLDVVVVGGGLVGLCAAYYLQRAGMRITLLEQGALAANVPAISLQDAVQFSMDESRATPLTRRGLTLFSELLEDLGYRDNCFIEGTVMDGYDVFLHEQNSQGNGSLAVHLKGMLCEVADLLRDRGGRVFELAQVHKLNTTPTRVTGVSTSIGDFCADEIVVAAGLGSQWLMTPIGLKLGIKIGTCKDFAVYQPTRYRRYVPLTSEQAPYVRRPSSLEGAVIAVGHGNDPVAALAVGEQVATLVAKCV